MKILYAIQGTGNGHLSRAKEIIPYLIPYGEVDLLVSGTQSSVQLPYLVKYKKHGLGFTFGTHGNIAIVDTVKNFRPLTLLKDILEFPVHTYDIIINDFEPLTAWACKLKGKTCVALSHQASYLSNKSPRPDRQNIFAEGILKNYAPASHHIGFHFDSFDTFIHRPVIRADVRNKEVSNHGHISVYLPAHSDTTVVKHLSIIRDVKWEVFSREAKGAYKVGNVYIQPISSESFTESLATGNGLLTAGGFEGPAEAIFLGKKVFSIPMSNQYEQLCNAEALKKLGVTVADQLNSGTMQKLLGWIHFAQPVKIDYTNDTAKIISELLSSYGTQRTEPLAPEKVHEMAWQ